MSLSDMRNEMARIEAKRDEHIVAAENATQSRNLESTGAIHAMLALVHQLRLDHLQREWNEAMR